MRRAAAGSHAAELGDDEKGKWPWFRVASRRARTRSIVGVLQRELGHETRAQVLTRAYACAARLSRRQRDAQRENGAPRLADYGLTSRARAVTRGWFLHNSCPRQARYRSLSCARRLDTGEGTSA
jgi:hypothetical protein